MAGCAEAICSIASYSRGPHTLCVPMELHALNRRHLITRLRDLPNLPGKCVVVLQGGSEVLRGSSDVDDDFRQESYFHWAFGVGEPDLYGAIDIRTEKAILFTPKLPESYVIWMGKLQSQDWFKERYCVDEVHYTEDMSKVLENMKPAVLLTLKGINTDSGSSTLEANFEGIANFAVDNTVLFAEMNECRVIKTPLEIDVLRYVHQVSSAAHKEVMRKIRPGMMEYHVQCIFQYHCAYYGGLQFMAYKNICASGTNSAILHYGHGGNTNIKILNDGEMGVFDLGGEYYCYASDITCSYPINGKFTDDQRAIYEAVLKANRTVIENMKPGVYWLDMHQLAESVILKELCAMGLLQGNVSEMITENLASVFMPHGIGHLIGCDVHDVGGYPDSAPPRPQRFGAKSLRTTRCLREGMVITVEPGIYFIEPLLNEALQDPKRAQFIKTEVLDRFRNFGGVRIEDGVLVEEFGSVILNDVPRTVTEIEQLMAAGTPKGDIPLDMIPPPILDAVTGVLCRTHKQH